MKHILFLFVLLFSTLTWAHQSLLLVGGGKRPQVALQKWGQAIQGKVLVITWASEIPKEVYEDIKNDLNQAGLDSFVSLEGPKNLIEKSALLSQISTAGGIFFSGGDQSKIIKVLQDQDVLHALKKSYWELEKPFAGTSAGTAIMSEKIILNDEIELTDGLGFLPHTVVDQHFIKRHREERLRKALARAPMGFLGVGVDEDGAILWENSTDPRTFKGEVLGDKQIMILRPKSDGSGYDMTLINPHEITVL